MYVRRMGLLENRGGVPGQVLMHGNGNPCISTWPMRLWRGKTICCWSLADLAFSRSFDLHTYQLALPISSIHASVHLSPNPKPFVLLKQPTLSLSAPTVPEPPPTSPDTRSRSLSVSAPFAPLLTVSSLLPVHRVRLLFIPWTRTLSLSGFQSQSALVGVGLRGLVWNDLYMVTC